MVKVLFVCMGNICRSPSAEGVFRDKVSATGLNDKIHIDSAGTHAYHIGNPPDPRSQQAAIKRNYDLSAQRARKVEASDFDEFDYILAMDMSNEDDLQTICPAGLEEKIHLFLKFSDKTDKKEVPDPYYGSGNGFETVLDLIEDAADGLITHLQKHHSL